MGTANERLQEKAAIAHAEWAQQTANDVGADPVALLLGAIIRRLDELNVRIDTLEGLLTKRQNA